MQGLVTDVAIKRKIRNMVAWLGQGKPGYDIYVEAGVALTAQHERAYAALGLQPGTAKPADQDQARQWMCQAFFDVRMFGAVMTTGKALCGRVRGPVQLSFSRSVGPVLAQEHGLTSIHPRDSGSSPGSACLDMTVTRRPRHGSPQHGHGRGSGQPREMHRDIPGRAAERSRERRAATASQRAARRHRPGHVMRHQRGPGTGRLPGCRPRPCPDGRRAGQDVGWLTGLSWSVIWSMLELPPPDAPGC